MNLCKERHTPQYWENIKDCCYTFLKRNVYSQFLEVLNSTEEKAHYAINVDYLQLFDEYPAVGQCLLKHANQILPLFDTAAKRIFLEVYAEQRVMSSVSLPSSFSTQTLSPSSTIPSLSSLVVPMITESEVTTAQRITTTQDTFTSKLNMHIRIHSLPTCAELTRTEFPSCKEAGTFLCLLGTVIRAGSTKLLEYWKLYQCNKCRETVPVNAVPERCHIFPTFAECPKNCPHAIVAPVANTDRRNGVNYSKFRDYQEIKVQEQLQGMTCGRIPKVMTVILEDDVVGSCKPGDDVEMTGYLYLRWKPIKRESQEQQLAEADLVFKANHVINNTDQKANTVLTEEIKSFVQSFWNYYQPDVFEGRNVIVSSFCPEIYGMYAVKLALCIVLAGGVSKSVAGTRIRGESHILLVGDAGIGKSQLLKYASKLFPRSVLTTGVGTTSAGLTVSAVKENGDWHLEAGALVLANGGVCCIDEFSCINEHDRTSIHEAMEQQTISVAKAGIVTKLSTRATIIAATNPRNVYEPAESLSKNTGIDSPLLSRFDIIMLLQDVANDEWDNYLADFILRGDDRRTQRDMIAQQTTDGWDIKRLKAYFMMIKDIEPVMTPDATKVIRSYYLFQRALETRDAARTSVRLLESLRRLSEGHARLMFRTQVVVHDVISAVSLLETSTQCSSSIAQNASNSLHTTFPLDSIKEYRKQARILLQKLGLLDLWELERKMLDEIGTARDLAKSNGWNLTPYKNQTPAQLSDTLARVVANDSNNDLSSDGSQ